MFIQCLKAWFSNVLIRVYPMLEDIFSQCLKLWLPNAGYMFSPYLKTCLPNLWRHVQPVFEDKFTQYLKTFSPKFEDIFTQYWKIGLSNVLRHVYPMFAVIYFQCLKKCLMFTQCLNMCLPMFEDMLHCIKKQTLFKTFLHQVKSQNSKWQKIRKTKEKQYLKKLSLRNYNKKRTERQKMTQKNSMETKSIYLLLFNCYAPMHKFCTCYIYLTQYISYHVVL